MTKNYNYYCGGSLPLESDTYVKRQADDLLFQNLRNANFSYVLNSRQMGKSSLMLRTKQRLEKDGVGCAAIDLTIIGSQNINVTEWYRGVVKQIVDGLGLEINWKKWWKEKRDEGISTVQMFGDFLREALLPELANNQGQAVIFLDEIDSIINLDFGTDDFLAFIRACHNKRAEFPLYNRLTFCLLGVATPSDLIADKTRTPFNIGTAIELTGFTFEEAKDALTPGLAEKVDDPEATLQKILDWTGRQPFLTQKLCNLVVEKAEGSSADIPQLVQTYIINNWEGQDNPEHLRTIRDRILRNEHNTSRLLGLYRQVLTSEVAADASPEQMELRLSGLVVKRDGCLQVYNNIYREIFDGGWIEAELNKLRPYSEAINAWLKSKRQDTSRLLRGTALEEAVEWGREKNLSVEDYAFLSESQEVDRQEIQIAILRGHSGPVWSVSFSPDGKMLATGSDDRTARLWDLQGNQIAELAGHRGYVKSVSFSPDGKMLATASWDNTARLWPVENLEELLARGCEWLRGYFVNHPEALAELEVCQLCQLAADFEADGWPLENRVAWRQEI